MVSTRVYLFSEIESFIPKPFVVHGDTNALKLSSFKPIKESIPGSASFVRAGAENLKALLSEAQASLVFVESGALDDPKSFSGDRCLVEVEDPRTAFAGFLRAFSSRSAPVGIHPSSQIHPEAEIESGCSIGPLCIIGRCKIGKNAIIYGNVCIDDKVEIGANAIIHYGAVIGGAGYGFVWDEASEAWQSFPQIGGVVIGDDVEIGANTCVDRGTLGNTIIRDGAKVDNLVHIAHNVEVGAKAMITASATVAGSVKIGDRAWIAPSAVIRDGVEIGDSALVGVGAVVTKSIPSGEVWKGNPARPR